VHPHKYNGIVEQLQANEHSISLRKRVELLEQLREDACMRREREAVDSIDAQIKYAVCEWIDSLIVQLKSDAKVTGNKAA
jgi:NADPH-dependent glutamate synthase beta subunit-like oxidoreductase